ncbi:MAG: hypothetical protein WCC41_08220 [Rhodomicrobium sp.]
MSVRIVFLCLIADFSPVAAPDDDPPGSERGRNLRLEMTDIVMLALGVGFFVIALAYVAACDRL